MSNGLVRLKSASLFLVGGAGELHTYFNVAVKVKNVAYLKDVQIRYRHANVWQDRSLTWKNNYGDYDLFTLEPALDFGGNPFVEFAIRFTSGGSTYWDNNNSANYLLTPTAGALTGGNATLSLARRRAPGSPDVEGEIFVNNLSYKKAVGIRHTDNGWTTHTDTAASYSQSSEGGSLERWVFGRSFNPQPSGRVEFAVYYQNLETGQYFWDNNFGQNYDMTYRYELE